MLVSTFLLCLKDKLCKTHSQRLLNQFDLLLNRQKLKRSGHWLSQVNWYTQRTWPCQWTPVGCCTCFHCDFWWQRPKKCWQSKVVRCLQGIKHRDLCQTLLSKENQPQFYSMLLKHFLNSLPSIMWELTVSILILVQLFFCGIT